MADESHTILLVQYNVQLGSRCYHDFEGRSLALDYLLGIYEKELKRLNPGSKSITYDIADVHGYLDQLSDVACLEFDSSLGAYVPRRKPWLKDQLIKHLQQQAEEDGE
ncbi:hypothetical protein EMIHUDRAFT_420106 [Emiliania huxleyi CCMP1516]|uniref:Enhancer of rudimentary homolog n=2 Tax=Emiliania huxleyi TaxID=2903 RepID=A0A0D3KDH7_EMIH1|nr:hypothetical protein EMIHUDRAFT_427667 [Emiliania huxleyi CCMP1516]XP_005786241.1 hypothetical protein EMIHUDRAFT_420106 [Emiliania huxleyi CCMP1516]EOD15428.1 hypothetical protein EMIHUDRAFT_427667 [Emiliania huxleyi CCMP1516]EOD33812.1 hypothetical protein EMIHUDRAFT_420106 [Emiliania huxleyi CCMP1516]|mmetsp:Transcript_7077/g.23370  ORF Transcript_7077/g.23370 Transcript_7077/m.23370 type:complete len:108 (+) Transcript_7077:36-359(+)|eukprot:XP_005767857.1 hypothetical protein EMIHUDRAFT_427667 [Emiliania huxleyi CCMP1516]